MCIDKKIVVKFPCTPIIHAELTNNVFGISFTNTTHSTLVVIIIIDIVAFDDDAISFVAETIACGPVDAYIFRPLMMYIEYLSLSTIHLLLCACMHDNILHFKKYDATLFITVGF